MSRYGLFILLFLFGLMWGGTIPLTKIAVSTGHHPTGLIFWQLLLSALALGTLLYFRRQTIPVDRDHIVFYAIIAIVGTIIPNGFSYLAAFHLPGAVMALVIAMVPMFALLIALIFRLEMFQPLRMSGVILGAIAIAMIVLPETGLPDPSKALFVLVALIAPLFYGVEANFLSVSKLGGTNPLVTLFGAAVVGVLITLPGTIALDGFIDPRAGFGAPEWALIGQTVLHIAAYAGYIWMIGRAGPVFSSQVAYIVTPAGVVFSVLFLDEIQSPWLWLAMMILLIGISLVQPRESGGSLPERGKTTTP